ncbi:3'-5' exonuclease [uncultured Clostridium sp.]|uniref:3'-5' exonuclease n=1 Tax=uncultured Clostridium sp. TaxID=59620 RepID=UPI0025E9B819|nr:3'-5' exonuclease [uncultured Clostridium sp.]
MGYIIVDLEFNNLKNITKYYEKFFDDNKELKDIELENEIIEIGAIKVDQYMKPICEMREYIKPTIFPVINPKVTEITKIDSNILNENGISFEEAINKLKGMFEKGDVLCSWAKDDVAEIIINANYHEYKDLNWLDRYLDIQEYASRILAHKKVLGLKTALDELKIRVDETKLHDALNDAFYTVEVFKRIYNSRIIKNHIVHDIYNMPAINVSDLEGIDIDNDKLEMKCPKCGKRIILETSLERLNWRFGAIGRCQKCKNKILFEVIVKKTLQGEIGYKEISSILKEDVYLNYVYKFDNMKERKI